MDFGEYRSDAMFIWCPWCRENQYVAALGAVNLPAMPERVCIRIFADVKYKLYVNGEFVNSGPAQFRRPEVRYDFYDISGQTRSGRNEVFVIAYHAGVTLKYNTAAEPGILADVRAECGGKTFSLTTGPDWKVADLECWSAGTPRKNWAIEFVEEISVSHPAFGLLARYASCDYGLETEGVGEKGIDQGLWTEPRVFDCPDLVLRERGVADLVWRREDAPLPSGVFRTNTEIYSLQDSAVRLDHEKLFRETDDGVYEALKYGFVCVDRREGEKGYGFVYDMRRMCAGDVTVEIRCEAPCTVDVALAENLRADGHPVIWRNGGIYLVRYRLAKGRNLIRNYHFNGQRYMYVSAKDAAGRFEIVRVTVNRCRAGLDYRDGFSCEDRRAETLYRICRRSIMLNTQADLHDCNTREQGVYWGDSIWIADSVGHMTGDFRHMRELCLASVSEKKALGMLNGSLYGLGGPLYDYCLVPPELLARYYAFTGDRSVVDETVDTVREIVEEFRGYRNSDGLLETGRIAGRGRNTRGGILFLDHPGNGWHPMTTTGIDREDVNSGFNLFFLQALKALDFLEKSCGGGSGCSAEADRLAEVIRGVFLMKNTGLIADSVNAGKKTYRYSQIANALAVTTGVFCREEARTALSMLLDIERHPWISQGSPFSYFFLADAAAVSGMVGAAVRAFVRDYAVMYGAGATTTWEAWNAENHDSLNHAWSAPMPFLVRKAVMGLRPTAPGYLEAQLQPQFSCFDTFGGQCMTPRGGVSVSWRRVDPATVAAEVRVPEGIKCRLVLPDVSSEMISGQWAGSVVCRRGD